jgi:hypothetical protein
MNERETMQETMEREKAEAIATLNRANRALGRIFNLEEEEEKVRCNMCTNVYDAEVAMCSECLTDDYLMDIGGKDE